MQDNLFLHSLAAQVKEFANIKSEQDLRLKVRDAFFGDYSVDVEDERIDFLVYYERGGFFTETFMWAESKDKPTDVIEMFAQLLLTIKKKIDAGEMPPKYLGVFDREKIAFTEYSNALRIFNLNDFNWSERPSSVSKKTVNQVEKYLKNIVQFRFESDANEIRGFIRENFVLGNVHTRKARINKNNFVTIYNKWIKEVLPSISLSSSDWKNMKKNGVVDGDFYLADLLSKDNMTIGDKLKIVLKLTYYESKVQVEDRIKPYYEKIDFRDKGVAHSKFWARYERPPKKEYHKHILERRDLLVPQDIRERVGAYFTPQIWVEKSQEYLAKVFGENWQEEYYIWDCCAGTCNLLVGLTEKHRIWASTIDQPDVDIVHEIIDRGALNLLKSHVFPFDFLNGDFKKLPKSLRDVLNDPEKREKLIIYINPPYAEGGNYTGRTKSGVATDHPVHQHLKPLIGKASNEVFALFFARIRETMPSAHLAAFASVKYVNAYNFQKYRQFFKANYRRGYICLAKTFDNVQGEFPIGFLIWSFSSRNFPKKIRADIFNIKGQIIGQKDFYNGHHFINEWIDSAKNGECPIGFLSCKLNEFQYNQYVCICNTKEQLPYGCKSIAITKENLIESCIYLAVRHSISLTAQHKEKWIRHNDPFLFPDKKYKQNITFQNDCLIFALLYDKNKICSNGGENLWIPFTDKEVDAKDNFQSTFMSGFLQKRKLSKEAKRVFEAGKALWRYYHETIKLDDNALVDASLYEIREYFKGRNEKGRMNTKAADERFNELDSMLRMTLKLLAAKIGPKVYEYGFLKK